MAVLTKNSYSTPVAYSAPGFDASYADDIGGYTDFLYPFKTINGSLADDFLWGRLAQRDRLCPRWP